MDKIREKINFFGKVLIEVTDLGGNVVDSLITWNFQKACEFYNDWIDTPDLYVSVLNPN